MTAPTLIPRGREGAARDSARSPVVRRRRVRIGIKTGAVGGERIAKLNELIRIEEEL